MIKKLHPSAVTQQVKQITQRVQTDVSAAPQLLNELTRALERLAERLALLESAISVGADGSVVLASSRSLTLACDQRIVISANQQVQLTCLSNTVTLDPASVAVNSAGRLECSAAMVQVTTSTITNTVGMLRVSGTVQCDTIIASTVVGSSYTPGAGNLW
jgi:hypothetical protein